MTEVKTSPRIWYVDLTEAEMKATKITIIIVSR